MAKGESSIWGADLSDDLFFGARVLDVVDGEVQEGIIAGDGDGVEEETLHIDGIAAVFDAPIAGLNGGADAVGGEGGSARGLRGFKA